MSEVGKYLNSSLGKKHVVGVSGLLLILMFLIPHLLGNLTMFGGEKLFNGYSHILHSLGPILWLLEGAIALLFLVHIVYTIRLVIENKIARGNDRYAMSVSTKERSFATASMKYTGLVLIVFLFFHLKDYVFVSHEAANTMLNGADAGLFGLVVNSFQTPVRIIGYLFAVIAIGLHVSHAIQSVFQTFGLRQGQYVKAINVLSYIAGAAVALGFVSVLSLAILTV
jgi:succinate dehydrogenase / fumarate reductase, cytochrome b subunit